VLPPELSQLLGASDRTAQEAAWKVFLETHSRQLLLTARVVYREYDGAMDGYAYLLDELRCDDFRRLRAYVPKPGSKFTTWLVVVARRLCVDHLRQRYGRPTIGCESQHRIRRQLVDLVTDDLDASDVSSEATHDNPEVRLATREQRSALQAAFAELEPRDRLLLMLRLEEELPAREIGQIMGFATPFHVYRRLNYLMNVLRKALRRRGIDGSDG
jgi:RNA polymerase sigma factor (sigma-70 family)